MASKTPLIFLFSSLLLILQLHLSSAQNVKAAYYFLDSGIAASDIDSILFTHLLCGFAVLDPKTNTITVSSANNAPFSQFTKTGQSKNPNVKTLLSISGENPEFPSMASRPTSRKSFIDSSIKLARTHGFHGLDLDWEYPETAPAMENLGLLFNEWRSAVATEAQATGESPLLLTAAVIYVPRVRGFDYPVQPISNSLDWVNVMAYDFYVPRDSNKTNSHAALFDPVGQVSGSYGIGAWIQAGLGSKKLVLGLPFYGYAWRLVDANEHGLLAPESGPVGPNNGKMGYDEIRNFINQNKATTVYNATVVTNYCYARTTWIGYDDTQSISAKVSYAEQNGLLGYFAWHVGNDSNWALSNQAKQACRE